MVTDTSANGIVNMLGLPLQDEGYLNPSLAIVDKRGASGTFLSTPLI